MHIFADGFTRVTLSNNNLRITLTQNGPDNSQHEIATLILPANIAPAFTNGLTNTLKQLEEQIGKRGTDHVFREKRKGGQTTFSTRFPHGKMGTGKMGTDLFL